MINLQFCYALISFLPLPNQHTDKKININNENNNENNAEEYGKLFYQLKSNLKIIETNVYKKHLFLCFSNFINKTNNKNNENNNNNKNINNNNNVNKKGELKKNEKTSLLLQCDFVIQSISLSKLFDIKNDFDKEILILTAEIYRYFNEENYAQLIDKFLKDNNNIFILTEMKKREECPFCFSLVLPISSLSHATCERDHSLRLFSSFYFYFYFLLFFFNLIIVC